MGSDLLGWGEGNGDKEGEGEGGYIVFDYIFLLC